MVVLWCHNCEHLAGGLSVPEADTLSGFRWCPSCDDGMGMTDVTGSLGAVAAFMAGWGSWCQESVEQVQEAEKRRSEGGSW